MRSARPAPAAHRSAAPTAYPSASRSARTPRLDDSNSSGCQQPTLLRRKWQDKSCSTWSGGAIRLGDANSERRTRDEILLQWQWGKYKEGSCISRPSGSIPENLWSDYRVIVGADGKARRIEPGIEPLADGISNGMVHGIADSVSDEVNSTQQARKKRIAGYGNAIVPQVAATFIRAFVESI